MDLAAAAAGARATRISLLWAGWSSWRTWAGATPRYGTDDQATLRERTDASVRYTGLGAAASRSTWHVQVGYCFE
jgi:hypothetical protein